MRQSRPMSLLVGTLMVLPARSGVSAEYAKASLAIGGSHAASCASAEELTSAVDSRLGRHAFVTQSGADLFVNIDFSRQGTEWLAWIDLRSITGQSLGRRNIESKGRDCADMNDSLALVLALMIDLTEAELQTKVSPLAPVDSTKVHVPSVHDLQRVWSPAMTLTLLSTVGQLPSVGWGGRLAAQVRHLSGIGVEFGVAAVAPSTWNDAGEAQAKFNWYAADLGICASLLGRTRSELAICAGSQLNFERARGSGYRVNRVQSTTSLLPFVKLESSYRLIATLGLHLALTALAPLVRDRFYATRVDGAQTTIFSTSPIAAQLEAGLSLGF